MARIFVATQSAVTQVDGRTITIRRGITRVEEGHELLERLAHLFEPVEAAVQYRVETARQEPTAPKGRRGGRRTKKEPTAPKTPAEGADEGQEPEGGAEAKGSDETPEGR